MALLPVKLPANIGTTLRQQQEQGLCCGGGHHHGCDFSLGVLRVVSRGVDMTFVGCALFTILHVIGLVECSSEKVFSLSPSQKRRSLIKTDGYGVLGRERRGEGIPGSAHLRRSLFSTEKKWCGYYLITLSCLFRG